MVCSLPEGITSRQGAGHPAHPPPVTPEHRATPLGPPPAPALVTTGSASRVSHRKIPLQPSQRGRGADGGDCPSEAPHLSGGQPREGWQMGLGQALPGSAARSGKLEGSAEGKVQRGRGKEGELLGPPAPRAASPHPLGVSSQSGQGQQGCKCIVWGGWSQAGKHLLGWARGTERLAPGAPPSASAGAPTRSPRGSLSTAQHLSPRHCWGRGAPAGRAPQLWASRPPQLFPRHVPPRSPTLRIHSAAAKTSPESGSPSTAG